MKKVITLVLATTALIAAAAVAIAQTYPLPVIETTGSITPIKKAAKDPKGKKTRNVEVKFKSTVNKEANVTAKTIIIKTDKNIKLSGTGFPFCTFSTLSSKGASACPKGSEIGSGGAKAVLGPNQTPLTFNVRLFASAARDVSLLLSGSVSVPAPLKGKLNRTGTQLTITVPPEVQQPVPGLFASLTELEGEIDAVTRKGKGFAQEKKCGVHRLTVTVEFSPNGRPAPAPASDSTTTKNTCKKR